jgi:recombinational DNA repair ATPase RecF
MKILDYSDVHVYPHSEYSHSTTDGLTTYLHEIRDSLYWVAEKIIEVNPDVVMNDGDYFHTYGYVDTMSLKVGQQGYRKIKEACANLGIPHHAIPGNHDMYSDLMQIHALGFMGNDVVDDIRVIETGAFLSKDRIRILCIPYTDDLERVRASLVKRDFDHIHSHLRIKGAVRYQGNLEDHGLAPEEFPVPTFNGHYHHPSDFGNVHIVGSLTTRTYHDLIPELGRGIGVYDTETGKFTRENNPYAHQFHKVKITEESSISALRRLGGKRSNCRVYYKPTLRPALEKFRAEGAFDNLDLIPLPEQFDAPVRKPGVSIDLSPEENLRAWLRTTETTLSKGRLFKEALEIISQARNASGRISSRNAIIFLRVRIVNYGPFEDQEVPLQGQGFTLIEGENHVDDTPSNGSGKTSVPDAVYWCLTGKSFRNSEFKGKKIIREIDAKETPHPDGCFVETDFMIGPSEFSVRRAQDHKEYGTGVTLWQDGEDISARLKKGVQEHVSLNLGIAEKALFQTTILAANLSNRFTALGDADRKLLLEEVGGSVIYEAIRNIAATQTALAQQALGNLRQQIGVINGQMTTLQTQQADANARKIKLEEESRTLQDKLNVWIEDAQVKINDKVNELESNRRTLERNAGERALQFGKINQVDAKIMELTTQRTTLTGTFTVSQNLKEKLDKLNREGHCDFCGQSVEVKDVSERLAAALAKCTTIEQQVAAINKAYETLTLRKQQIMQAVRTYDQYNQTGNSRNSTLEQEISRLNQQIAQWKTAMIPSTEAVNQVVQETQRLLQLHAEQEAQWSILNEAIPALEENVRYAEFWYVPSNRTGGFSPQGLPSFVLESLVQAINEELDEISPLFLRDQKIRLTNQIKLGSGESRNKIGVELIGGRHLSKLSTGERRKVDLSIQFALNEVARAAGASTNILFCDEIDSFLDEGGLQAYVAALGKKSQSVSVFCTTQNTILKSFISKKWVVKKTGDYPGISRISFS